MNRFITSEEIILSQMKNKYRQEAFSIKTKIRQRSMINVNRLERIIQDASDLKNILEYGNTQNSSEN